MLRGFIRNFKPLELLSEEEIENIHKAVLDVLRETGVRFESKRAMEDLKKIGCQVDHEEMRVRFPEYLVEEAARRCPSSFRIKARDSRNDLILGGNTVYFQNFPGMQTVDLDTWEPRDATMQEYHELVTVLDALPNLHSQCAYPYYGYQGVPSVMRIPEGVAIKIRDSTKVQLFANASDCDQFNIEMVKASGGEAICLACGSAPLTWYDDQIRAAYRAVESGFPIFLDHGAISGSTAPATVAGTVVANFVEFLAMIVLLQSLKPGMRIHIGSDTYPQNMKTGAPGFGRISGALIKAVENQMGRFYGLPMKNCAPGPTSSKKADFQAGYEKGINALAGALTGTHFFEFHSCIYGEISAHPLQAILDDDIAGMVGRFIEGVTVSSETIALELIEQVGPIPGNYLGTKHTREWWQKEQFVPKAADDLTYPEWKKTGKKDCLIYAKERMEGILATHKTSIALTSSQEKAVGAVLKEARAYYRKNGMISDEEWQAYEAKVLGLADYPFA